MNKLICNPLNLEYRYQIKKTQLGSAVFREAADPTVVLFKGTYFLFASMSGGFWYSDDLYSWKFKYTPELPFYDYAPDVREIGGYVVFSASRLGENCTFYRCDDPLTKPFEPFSTAFDFWDPDIFQDDDGRVYFYWGCSNKEPIWGMELDPQTLKPLSEKVAVISENEAEHGWERRGENNKLDPPKTPFDEMILKSIGTKPFIEGAFMTKHKGRYYLQYAGPGTEYNVYGDGVYVGEKPLGPFTYQPHNPFSLKPGGFITGAGHGSTFQDKFGNWWHISTMRISINENFERRIGLFPCAFDEDGVMYCNQNFADYPFALPEGKQENMSAIEPPFMLLSYGKEATASSSQPGYGPQQGTDENIRTWWAATESDDNPWFMLDLGKAYDVKAIQLNFADHKLPFPQCADEDMFKENFGHRLIKTEPQLTQFLLECSADGKVWADIKNSQGSDYAHDFIVFDKPLCLRYLRVSKISLPLGGVAAISGLRVFGRGHGGLPAAVEEVKAERRGQLNILLSWQAAENADGYNVRYGLSKDKLYSSWQLYGVTQLDLSTVSKGQGYYIAVDSFNENGVTPGRVVCVR